MAFRVLLVGLASVMLVIAGPVSAVFGGPSHSSQGQSGSHGTHFPTPFMIGITAFVIKEVKDCATGAVIPPEKLTAEFVFKDGSQAPFQFNQLEKIILKAEGYQPREITQFMTMQFGFGPLVLTFIVPLEQDICLLMLMQEPAVHTVQYLTPANGSFDAEVLPNVRLRADFTVDCSDPDPSKHKLLANTLFTVNTIGTRGQDLTAATISAIQVIAAEQPLFAQLTPADFNTATSGSTTIISPKLQTLSGQTKICTGLVPAAAANDYDWKIDGPKKKDKDKYQFTVTATPKAPPGALPVVVTYKWRIRWSNNTISPPGADNPAAGSSATTGNPVNVVRPANVPAGGTATLEVYAQDDQKKWVKVATATFTQ